MTKTLTKCRISASNHQNVRNAIDSEKYLVPMTVFNTLPSKKILALQGNYIDFGIWEGGSAKSSTLHITSDGTVIEDLCDPCDDDKPYPILLPVLNSLLEDRNEEARKDIIQNLQIFLGYAFSGENSLHNVLILHGSGRNGKGLLTRAIRDMVNIVDVYYPRTTEIENYVGTEVLGYKTLESRIRALSPSKRRAFDLRDIAMPGEFSLCTTINKGNILFNGAKSSTESSHTAQVMNVLGARLVVIDELDDKDRIDASRLKQLSGGDAILLRPAYGKTLFLHDHPTHTLLLCTNHVPYMPYEPSLTERIKVLSLNMFFNHDAPSRHPGKNERQVEITRSHGFRYDLLRWILRGANLFYLHGSIPWLVLIFSNRNQSNRKSVRLTHQGGGKLVASV